MRLVVGDDDDDDCDVCTGLVRVDGDVPDDFLRIVRGVPNIFWFGDHATTVDAINATASSVIISIVLEIMVSTVVEGIIYIRCMM